MDSVLAFLSELPPMFVYAFLGLGTAVENVIPPIPADTFVLLGGFIAARGPAEPFWVWIATWGLNVASALFVYGVGHRHGKRFFEHGIGRHLLRQHQLGRMRRFYQRFGVFAIFFTRFLPGLRAVVPAFAGVSHQPFLPVAVPLAAASGIWYGVLVWLGATAGRNLDALLRWLDQVNLVLLGVAALLLAGVVWWWVHSRRGEAA